MPIHDPPWEPHRVPGKPRDVEDRKPRLRYRHPRHWHWARIWTLMFYVGITIWLLVDTRWLSPTP